MDKYSLLVLVRRGIIEKCYQSRGSLRLHLKDFVEKFPFGDFKGVLIQQTKFFRKEREKIPQGKSSDFLVILKFLFCSRNTLIEQITHKL